MKKLLISALTAAALGVSTLSAHAADTIKIGEINHYKRMAAFANPYKNLSLIHI